jgi:hypothetical protein
LATKNDWFRIEITLPVCVQAVLDTADMVRDG